MRYRWITTTLDAASGTVQADLTDALTGEILHRETVALGGVTRSLILPDSDNPLVALAARQRLSPVLPSRAYRNTSGDIVQPVSARSAYINGGLFQKTGPGDGDWTPVNTTSNPIGVLFPLAVLLGIIALFQFWKETE